MKNIHENGSQRKGVDREILSAPDSYSERTATQASKIDLVLDAVDRGFVPFPLGPDSAEPAFPQGDAMATKNKALLRSWWNEDPNYNVGISTENLLTLRITERCPPATVAQLALLFQEHDAPKGVITRRGTAGDGAEICLHFLLPDGAVVTAQSDVLFAGIDVLSNDDFVVGPGSILDGLICTFVDEKSLLQASPWLLEVCGVELPKEDVMPNVVRLQRAAAEALATKASAPKPNISSTFITKKAAALAGAKQGFNVFPIWPYVHPGENATPEQFDAAAKQAKAPLVKNWQILATQDPKQIDAWWTEWPDANIAGATESLVVVDVDPRHGGNETFETLSDVADFPPTAVQNTQGGGQHHIYAAPDRRPVKGGTNKLGKGIDIKARGGYILLAGSTIEGRAYTRTDDRPIALAPQWIVDQCNVARPKNDAAGKRIVEEDETAVELATRWMLNSAPSAEFGEIDDTTYKVAARVFDFGVLLETATDIVLEWNEIKCNPPGDTERLLVVVESAGRNRENAIGSRHPLAPGFEAVEIEERPPTKPAAPASTGLATPLLQFDPIGLELRPWVIPGFACRGRVTLLAGPGGVAKSTYYLMVAIATVSGRGDICGFPRDGASKGHMRSHPCTATHRQFRGLSI